MLFFYKLLLTTVEIILEKIGMSLDECFSPHSMYLMSTKCEQRMKTFYLNLKDK